MPVLLLREQAAGPSGSAADREIVALLDGDLSSDSLLAEAVAALRRHEVVARTRQQAVVLAHAAVAELEPLPAGSPKDALVSFAAALVDRAS